MIKGETNPVYYKGYEEGKQQTLKDEIEFLKKYRKINIEMKGTPDNPTPDIDKRIKQIKKELGEKREKNTGFGRSYHCWGEERKLEEK